MCYSGSGAVQLVRWCVSPTHRLPLDGTHSSYSSDFGLPDHTHFDLQSGHQRKIQREERVWANCVTSPTACVGTVVCRPSTCGAVLSHLYYSALGGVCVGKRIYQSGGSKFGAHSMTTAAASRTRIAALNDAAATRPRTLRPPASTLPCSPLCLEVAVPWHSVMCFSVLGERFPVDASFLLMLLPSMGRRGQQQQR